MKKIVVAAMVTAAMAAGAETLTWKGASGASWEGENWLDASGNTSAWVDGADAVFTGTGGFVIVTSSAPVPAGSITFGGDRFFIAGGSVQTSTLLLTGPNTNSVAATLIPNGTLSISGTGAVSLGAVKGPVSVESGTLLALSSGLLDADITVAEGAALGILGIAAQANNLVSNGSFESPTLDAGKWSYLSDTHTITNWYGTASHAGTQNTTANTAWTDAGSQSDGSNLAMVQFSGMLGQTVTVAEAGCYVLSFDYSCRSGYNMPTLVVAVDDIPVATFTIMTPATSGMDTFASPLLWLGAGEHRIGFSVANYSGDATAFIDDVRLGIPGASGESAALAGFSVLRGAGAIAKDFSGTLTLGKNASTGTATGGGTLAVSTVFHETTAAGGLSENILDVALPSNQGAGTPQWTVVPYDPATWTASANNVLPNATASFVTGINWYTEAGKNLGNILGLFTDQNIPGATIDYAKISAIANNGSLTESITWFFATITLSEIHVYTRWKDGGRDGLGIKSVEVYDSSTGKWTTLANGSCTAGQGNNNSGSALYGRFAASEAGAPIALNASGLRISFGVQDNTGTGYVEIEAIKNVDFRATYGTTASGALFSSAGGRTWTNDLGSILLTDILFSGMASDTAGTLAGSYPFSILGTAPNRTTRRVTLNGLGELNVSAPISLADKTTVDVAGNAAFESVVASGSTIRKLGAGLANFGTNSITAVDIIDGAFAADSAVANSTWNLYAYGTQPTAIFNQVADADTKSFGFSFFGNALGTFTLAGAGKTFNISDYLHHYGSGTLAIDVEDANATLTTRQILRNGQVTGNILKTGYGTLRVTNGGYYNASAGWYGTIAGQLTIENGTFAFTLDDIGAATTGDALGCNLNYPLEMGDEATPADATPALLAESPGTITMARDITVNPYGDHAILAITGTTLRVTGTITAANDIAAYGELDGSAFYFDSIVAADTSPVTIDASSGKAALAVGAIDNGSGAGISIVAPNGFVAGESNVVSLACAGLSIANADTVQFSSAGNDMVAASGELAIANGTAFTLKNLAGDDFSETGVYTLFTYGTFTGDVSSLFVSNGSTDFAYVFKNDTEAKAITLTIMAAEASHIYLWKASADGDWEAPGSWDRNASPNVADTVASFGTLITNDITATVTNAVTVGHIVLSSTASVTLAGGTVTFATGDGTASTIYASAGNHVISAPVALGEGTGSIEISTADGASITFATATTVPITITRGNVYFLEDAANVTVAKGVTLNVGSGNSESFTDPTFQNGSILALASGATGTVSVTSGDTAFDAALTGSGLFAKEGNGMLTLNETATVGFTGSFLIAEGALSLAGVGYNANATVAGGATLKAVDSGAGDIIGTFYQLGGAPANNKDLWQSASRLKEYLASLTPTAAYPISSHLTGSAVFDVTDNSWPSDFTDNFIAVWQGSIDIPATGNWAFGLGNDDYVLLAIDGNTIAGTNACVSGHSIRGAAWLGAGRHDFFLALAEITGSAHVTVYCSGPTTTYPEQVLPLSWLSPASAVSGVKGTGTVSIEDGVEFRIGKTASGASTFSGTVSANGDALLALDGGFQELAGLGTYVGAIAAVHGTLAFSTNAILAAATPINIGEDGILHAESAVTAPGVNGRGGMLTAGSGAYVFAVTGDNDCGIDSAKTYTHAVSLGNAAGITVNGVTFTGVTASDFQSGNWGGNPAGTEGFTNLVYNFRYGKASYDASIDGLTPGASYDFRFYFRSFGVGAAYYRNRHSVVTFTTGGKCVGQLDFDPEHEAYSVAGCSYIAGDDGVLKIHVDGQPEDNMHTYAYSNELLANALNATPVAVNLAPPSGKTAMFGGSINGNAAVSLTSEGIQRLSGGAIATTEPVALDSGTLILSEGADILSPVEIANGSILRAYPGSSTIAGITGTGTFNVFSQVPHVAQIFFEGDYDSGIRKGTHYTHAIDFGTANNASTPTETINMVPFNQYSNSCPSVTVANGTAHGGGNSANAGSNFTWCNGLGNLLYDMYYGVDVTVTVKGLTAGKSYDFRFYLRRWNSSSLLDAGQTRGVTFTFDPTGVAATYHEEIDTLDPHYISYRYTATGSTLVIHAVADKTTDGFHCYGFTNQETDGDVTVDCGKDCTFAGRIDGAGTWVKSGNGSLTLTGQETSSSGQMTVAKGALVIGDDACGPLGPVDVANGALLCGSGYVCGNGETVTVKDGGHVYGGSGTAAGTLTIGGNLAFNGANGLVLRYGSGGYGAVKVNGTASIPTNGVLTVATWTAGRRVPTTAVVLSSDSVLNGPDDLSGWTLAPAEGVNLPFQSELIYSDDHKSLVFRCPGGTQLMLK